MTTPPPDGRPPGDDPSDVEIGRNGRRAADTSVLEPDKGEGPRALPRLTPAPTRRRRRPLRGVALTLLALIVLTVAVGLALRWQLSAPAAAAQPIEFEVLPGWGAARVAAELEAAGLIRDARVFSLWLRYRELDRSVGEGLYDLSPHQSADAIATALAAGGRPRTVRVVIPEGFRARDVAARVAAAGLADAEAFLSVVTEPRALRPSYLPDGAPLEGYLFPASYDIPLATDAEGVAELMVDRFRDEVDGDAAEALQVRALSVHDWVTLASMVQAEAAGPHEMPIIAGVFLNRLDLGMPLQSDPTVAYGLGKDLPELDVFAGDFERDHPWNTYTRPGTPEGPIGNPGSDALAAVLNPERLDDRGRAWLYFLHGIDAGVSVFRPNISLADHNRDVQRYLR